MPPVIATKLVGIASTRTGPVDVVLVAVCLDIAAIVSAVAATYLPANNVLVPVLFIPVSARPSSVAYGVSAANIVGAKEATHVIVVKLSKAENVRVGTAGVVQQMRHQKCRPVRPPQ